MQERSQAAVDTLHCVCAAVMCYAILCTSVQVSTPLPAPTPTHPVPEFIEVVEVLEAHALSYPWAEGHNNNCCCCPPPFGRLAIDPQAQLVHKLQLQGRLQHSPRMHAVGFNVAATCRQLPRCGMWCGVVLWCVSTEQSALRPP